MIIMRPEWSDNEEDEEKMGQLATTATTTGTLQSSSRVSLSSSDVSHINCLLQIISSLVQCS